MSSTTRKLLASKLPPSYGSISLGISTTDNLIVDLNRTIALLQTAAKPKAKSESWIDLLLDYALQTEEAPDLWPYGLDETFLETLLNRLDIGRMNKYEYKRPNQRELLITHLNIIAKQVSQLSISEESPVREEKAGPTDTKQESKLLSASCVGAKLFEAVRHHKPADYYVQLHQELTQTTAQLRNQCSFGYVYWPFGLDEIKLKLLVKRLNDLIDFLNVRGFYITPFDEKIFCQSSVHATRFIPALERLVYYKHSGINWFFERKPWIEKPVSDQPNPAVKLTS